MILDPVVRRSDDVGVSELEKLCCVTALINYVILFSILLRRRDVCSFFIHLLSLLN